MKFFKTRYRIITDRYLGYEVQEKKWWYPFWMQVGFTNTHSSIEAAKKYLEAHKGSVVYEE